VEKIAVSTNGSANWPIYNHLIRHGVNDFSVSLDSCCAAVGDKMAGGIKGSWEKVIQNIKKLSEKVYTTVGIVITEDNLETCVDTIILADSMGVSDIRVIPSAQYNKLLDVVKNVPAAILNKYPILKYRSDNIKKGLNVRGIKDSDSNRCWLAMDDMAVAGGYHFPCIIYMREQGDPIGKITKDVRKDRLEWACNHNTHEDPICRRSCLDVCVQYNNKVESFIRKPQ
jgi:sulfatase maturation enzyme AslB (radical SAM superfamily)